MIGLGMRLADLFKPFSSRSRQARRQRPLPQMGIESLEERLVLYAVSGNSWPHPELVTISFEPDGTNLGGVYSNLQSTFNNNPNLVGVWQGEILRAAQSWAQQTNINFVVVSDSGAGIGSGAYQQGSPTIGDIRIGGFAFGDSNLASAFMPPPINNQSLGGDIEFNTSVGFSVGGSIDLYTVAVHEIGHALGLYHSSQTSSVMFPAYNGQKPNLTSDDIAGIRNIYSHNDPRSKDGEEGANGNNNINDPANISGKLQNSIDGLVLDNLDITSTSDVDFYKVKLPSWTTSTMLVKVQSAGLSLLAPKLTVYAEDKVTVLGTATGGNSSTISVSVNGVGNNDVYYLKVEGANATAFGTGAYGLIVDLGPDTPAAVTPPNTMTPNGNPFSAGGGQLIAPDVYGTVNDDAPAAPTIAVAANSVSGTAAAGSVITILENHTAVGTTVADANGNWSFGLSVLAKGTHNLEATATDGAGNVSLESELVTVRVRRRK